MRVAALVVLALLAAPPTAQAASAVHLAWDGEGYVVLFDSAASAPAVDWEDAAGHHATATAVAQPRPPGDRDNVWAARLPPSARAYSIEGKRFEVHARPAADGPTRFAFVADMGRSADSWRVWDAVAREDPDLVIVGGDVSYANGRQELWDEWFAHVEPLASRVPVMTARGNHETICQDAQGGLHVCEREPAEYAEHFLMPGDSTFYAFEWGPVRFTALDTEAYHPDAAMGPYGADPAAQKAFLQRSLAAGAGSWNVVFFHRPLYSSNQHDDGADAAAHDDLVPALDAGGADLVLYGHAHAYERSWPMSGDRVAQRASAIREGGGIYYVDSGGGGRSLYNDFVAQPTWSAVRAVAFEYVVVDASKERIDLKAKTPDGETLDHVVIVRAGADVPSLQESSSRVPGLGLPLVLAAVMLSARRARRRARG